MKYYLILLTLSSFHLGISQRYRQDGVEDGAHQPNNLLSTPRIDSLKSILIQGNHQQIFDIQLGLFREYFPINSDSASSYINKSLELANLMGDSGNIVFAVHGKAGMLSRRGDLTGAIKLFEYALGIAKRNNYKNQVRYILNNLALAHTANTSYDKALQNNFESLKLRNVDAKPAEMVVVLHNIGYLYYRLRDYKNAISYFQQSYQISIENKIKFDLPKCLVNMGLAYFETGKFHLAEEKIREAFLICENFDCTSEILIEANQAMGEALFKQNEFQKSLEYFRKSLEISQELGMAEDIASSLYWLSFVSLKQGRITDALDYLNRSQKVAKKSGYQEEILRNYQLYVEIYAIKMDFEKALEYQRLHDKINARILNGELISRISQIQATHSEEINTAMIESQAKIMSLQKESINQHRLLNFAFGVVVLLAVGIAIVLFVASKNKEQINLKLDAMVRFRTAELEENRTALQHLHEQEVSAIRAALQNMIAHLATLRGLRDIILKDTLLEAEVYRNELDDTAKGLEDFINRLHLLLYSIEVKPLDK